MVGALASYLMAIAGGALSSTGANVLAWSSKAQRSGREWTRWQAVFFYAACFILNLLGIGLFALSTATGGAVATVMPLQTGASLFFNMTWQITLGIKHYDKNMRLGTMILIVAVAVLGNIGPKEPDKMDVLDLLQKPAAAAWVGFLVVGSILAIVSSILLLKQPLESMTKLVSLTTVVTLTTVLGSSVSKCFGLLNGFALFAAFGIYFVDGVILMGFTLLANAGCDVSLFIPAQLSSQLVVNMITGYLVWGDAAYIESANQEPYICIYLIIVLAVYLSSPEIDALGEVVRHYRVRKTRISQGVAVTPLGVALKNLSEAWRRRENDVEEQSSIVKDRETALRDALEHGLQTGAVSRQEVLELAMQLLGEKRYAPNASLIYWLQQCKHFKLYDKHDPEFMIAFRETLPREEAEQLAAMLSSCPSESGVSLQEQQAQADSVISIRQQVQQPLIRDK